MTAKKRKACIRNWEIFRLKGAATAISKLGYGTDSTPLTPRQKRLRENALEALVALQVSLKGNDNG
ncbi:MAG: hypothetical protein CL484_03190 [Acidobacteria bacterium]|nr:hypothetical protein [Acidobacteriota bacterium]